MSDYENSILINNSELTQDTVAESPVYEAVADSNTYYVQPDNHFTPVANQKKNKGLKILVVLLIFVLIACNAVTLYLLIGSKKGTLADIDVPDEYAAYLENQFNFFGSDGLIDFVENDKYGFVNKNGEVIIKAKFDDVSEFYNGLAVVMIDEKYAIIDSDGQYVVSPGKYDSIEDGPYACGLIKVQKDDKYGYINADGELVIPCSYYRATSMTADGYAVVLTKDKKCAVITQEGDLLEDMSFDNINGTSWSVCKYDGCYDSTYEDGYCDEHRVKELCKKSGCYEEAYEDGYCFVHYYVGDEICSKYGCYEEEYKNGYCFDHYLDIYY